MQSGKYDRNVPLICPTCAGSQFEFDDEDARPEATVRCTSCGREMTRDELLCENSENVQEHVKEIGGEVVQDIAEEMRKSLKKAVRGNKNIKFE